MSTKLDLVDMTEIARMLDMRLNTVQVWRVRGKLPPPVTELSIGPIWHRRDIEAWAANEVAKSQA